MKKTIEIIGAGAPLLEWAAETMRQAADKPSNADELIEGISGLLNDEYPSLVIERNGLTEKRPEYRKIHCGDISIDSVSRRVVRGDTEIVLTPKEFDILYFLASNRGEVFTKEQIYQAVWDNEYLLDDSNVMAFIRKIRKKIEPVPDAPRYILTIWGIGYKFNENL